MIDLEKLSQVNYSAAFNEIKSYFSKDNLSKFDFNTATIGCAYILLQIQRNPKKKFKTFTDVITKEFLPFMDDDGWFATIFIDYIFNSEEDVNTNNESLFSKLIKLKGKYSDEVLMALILFSDCNGRYYETGYTPKSVFSLALKLLKIKPNEKLLHISSCAGENYRDNFDEIKDLKVSAFDNEMDFMGVSLLRTCLLGKEIHYIEDPLEEKGLVKKTQKNIIYDLSISREILNDNYYTDFSDRFCKKILCDVKNNDDYEYHVWAAVATAMGLLEDSGKVAMIIPISALSSSKHLHDRQLILNHHWLETVISLPDRMFLHTRYPVALLIFSKNNNEMVRFIDAHEMGSVDKSKNGKLYTYFTTTDIETIFEASLIDSDIGRVVDLDFVTDNNCELNPICYFMKNEKLFGEGISVGSIVKSIVRGKSLASIDIDSEEGIAGFKQYAYLTSSNIQDGIITGEMTKFNKISDSDKKYVANRGDLVVCKNGPPFKVAYIGHEVSSARFLISDNLYIIKVDKNKVHPLFLKAFFESDEGNYAIRKVTTGARIQSLSVKGLKNIRIPDFSMERQLEIVQEYENIENQVIESTMLIEKCRKDIKNLFDYNF